MACQFRIVQLVGKHASLLTDTLQVGFLERDRFRVNAQLDICLLVKEQQVRLSHELSAAMNSTLQAVELGQYQKTTLVAGVPELALDSAHLLFSPDVVGPAAIGNASAKPLLEGLPMFPHAREDQIPIRFDPACWGSEVAEVKEAIVEIAACSEEKTRERERRNAIIAIAVAIIGIAQLLFSVFG